MSLPIGSVEAALEAERMLHQTAIVQAADKIEALEAEVEGLRAVLEHIVEYWNGAETHGAMSDALDHIIDAAEAALAGKDGG